MRYIDKNQLSLFSDEKENSPSNSNDETNEPDTSDELIESYNIREINNKFLYDSKKYR